MKPLKSIPNLLLIILVLNIFARGFPSFRGYPNKSDKQNINIISHGDLDAKLNYANHGKYEERISIISPSTGGTSLMSTVNSSIMISKVSFKYKGDLLITSSNHSNFTLQFSNIFANEEFSKPFIRTDSLLVLNHISVLFNNSYARYISSLIKSTNSSDIYLYNLELENIVHQGERNILFDGDIEDEKLTGCEFYNISWNNIKNCFKYASNYLNKPSFSSFEASSFKANNCETPYYGVITSLNLFTSASIHNSSFIFCFDTTSPTPTSTPTTPPTPQTTIMSDRTEFTSGSYTFSDTLFKCTSTNNGGALYCNNVETVTFTRCVFDECNVTEIEESKNDVTENRMNKEKKKNNNYKRDIKEERKRRIKNSAGLPPLLRGGSVYFQGGIIICESTNFTNGFIDGETTFLYLSGISSGLIHNCLFSNGSNYRLGGVWIDAAIGIVSISNSTFEKGTTEKFGGGSGLMVSEITNRLTVSSCFFQFNHAYWQGASIYFYTQSTPPPPFKFSFIYFRNNTSTDANGPDISFHPDFANNSYIDYRDFERCVTRFGNRRSVKCFDFTDEDSRCFTTEVVFLDDVMDPIIRLVNAFNGTDVFDCGGSIGEECKTMEFAGYQYRNVFDEQCFIQLETNVTEHYFYLLRIKTDIRPVVSPLSSSPNTEIKFTKASEDTEEFIVLEQSLILFSDFLMKVYNDDRDTSSCKLICVRDRDSEAHFSNCIISGGDDNSSVHSGQRNICILEVIEGQLFMNDTIFKNFPMNSVSLFSLDYSKNFAPRAKFYNMSFVDIFRLDGCGSIIETSVSFGITLSFADVSFIRCSCLNGNGGGLNVNLDEYSTFSVGNSSQEISHFKSCYSSKTDEEEKTKGGAIFVNCVNYSAVFIDNTIFGTEGESNIADYGNNIFVQSTNCILDDVVKHDSFKVTSDLDHLNDYVGMSNLTMDVYIPLCLIFWELPEFLFVNERETGLNEVYEHYCGFSVLQCKSLELAFNRYTFDQKVKKATIEGELNLIKPLIFNDVGYEVKGEDTNSIINVSQTCFFNIGIVTEFSQLPFIIPSSLNVEDGLYLFDVEEGFLAMNDCFLSLISGASTIEYTIWGVKRGVLNFNLLVFQPSSVLSISSSLIMIFEGGGEFNNLHVSNISLKESGEGTAVNAVIKKDKSLILENCSFSNCNSDGGNGGGIYVMIEDNGELKIQPRDEPLPIQSESFKGRMNKKEHIVKDVFDKDPVNIIKEEEEYDDNEQRSSLTVFKSCLANSGKSREYSKGNGGAMFIYIFNEDSKILLTEASFGSSDGNTEKNEARYGNNVFIELSEGLLFPGFIYSENCPFLIDTSVSMDYVGLLDDDKSIIHPLCMYLWPYPETLYISESFQYIDDRFIWMCGYEEYKCKSMEDALQSHSNFGNKRNIAIEGNLTINSHFSLDNLGFSFRKLSGDSLLNIKEECSFTVKIESSFLDFDFNIPSSLIGNEMNSLFYVLCGILSMLNINFYLEEETSTLSYAFWNVNGGAINITNVNFESPNLISLPSSLLSVISSDNVVNINDFEVENVTLPEGDGGAVNIQWNILQKLYLINSTFTRCNAPNGKGGGVWLKLDSTSVYSLEDLFFDSCSAHYGNNYFLVCPNLNETVHKLNGYIISELSKFEDAMGSVDTTYSDLIPLSLFFRSKQDKLQVSDNGFDTSLCGFSDYHCYSLSQAFSIQSGKTKNLVINGTVTESDKIIMDDICYLVSRTFEGGTIFANGCSFEISVLANITSLYFCIYKLSSDLVVTTSSSLLFDSCIFSVDSSITPYLDYSLFLLNDGNIKIVSVSIISSNSIIVNSPLLNFVNGCSILKELVVENFKSLTPMDGVAVNALIRETKNFSMEGCNFTKCCSNGGNGGAVYIEVENGDFLKIGEGAKKESIFKSCSSIGYEDKTIGRGGALYIKLNTQPSIVINNIIFGDNNTLTGSNTAACGSDLFLEIADSLFYGDFINTTSFSFLINNSVSENKVGAKSGDLTDIIPLVVIIWEIPNSLRVNGSFENYNRNFDKVCGYEDYPCLSIGNAVANCKGTIKNVSLYGLITFTEEVVMDSGSYYVYNGSTFDYTSGIVVKGGSFVISATSLLDTTSFAIDSLDNDFFFLSETIHTFENCSILLRRLEDLIARYSLFVVDSGEIRILSTYIVSVAVMTFFSPIVVINDGYATLNRLKVYFIKTSVESNGSALRATVNSGKSLTLDACEFSACCCNGGNGGAAYIELDGGGSVNIGEGIGSSPSFKRCSAYHENDVNTGKGGAIYFKSEDETASIKISSISLGENGTESGKNLAGTGSDIFVEAKNIMDCKDNIIFNFFNPSLDRSGDKDLECADDKYLDHIFWLGYIFVDDPSNITVGESGVNLKKCGFEDFPCETLSYGIDRLIGKNKLIRIKEKVTVEDILLLNENVYNISSFGKESGRSFSYSHNQLSDPEEVHRDGEISITTPLTSDTGGFFTSTVTSTFEDLIITFTNNLKTCTSLFLNNPDISQPSTLSFVGITFNVVTDPLNELFSISLIDVHAGAISLDDVVFGKDTVSKFSKSVISLNNNALSGTLSNVIFNNIFTSNEDSSIISITADCLIILNFCHFNSISGSSPSIYTDSIGSLTLGNSSFSFCSRIEGNGSCIYTSKNDESQHTVLVKDCAFETCGISGEKMCGGALYIDMCEKFEFTTENSSFSSCTANLDNGKGGAIFLDLTQKNYNYYVKFPYDDNNNAKLGKFLCLICPECQKGVSTSNFPNMVNVSDGNYIGLQECTDEGEWIVIFNLSEIVYSDSLFAYVDSNGNDTIAGLGSKSKPFNTFNYALKQKPLAVRIYISSTVVLNDFLNLTERSISFEPDQSNAMKFMTIQQPTSPLDVDSLISSSMDTGFKNIYMSLDTTLKGIPLLILVNGNKFSISMCSMGLDSMDSLIDYSLVKITSGVLDFQYFSTRMISFSTPYLIEFDGDSAEANFYYFNVFGSESSESGCLLKLNRAKSINIDGGTASCSYGKNTCSFIRSDKVDNLVLRNIYIDGAFYKGVDTTDGGGCFFNVGSGHILNITSSSFSNCKVEKGDGGGAALNLTDDGEALIGDAYSPVFFRTCSSVNKDGDEKGGGMYVRLNTEAVGLTLCAYFDYCSATHGKGLFASGWNLWIPAGKGVFDFYEPNETLDDKSNLEGSDDRFPDTKFWLGYLIISDPSNITVGEGGEDMEKCGYSDIPCKTLRYAFQRQIGKPRRVEIYKEVTISKDITFSQESYEIFGRVMVDDAGVTELSEVTDSEIKEKSDIVTTIARDKFIIETPDSIQEGAVFTSSINTLFSDLELLIPKDLKGRNSLFIEDSGSTFLGLTFSSCLLRLVDDDTADSRLEVNDENYFAIVTVYSGYIKCAGVNFSGFDNNQILKAHNDAVVFLDGVSLEYVSALKYNGTGMFFDMDVKGSVEINNCTLKSVKCSSSSEEFIKAGAGIYANIKGTGNFNVSESNFENCELDSKNGYGGAIYLELSQSCTDEYSFKDLTFSNNKAFLGSDIFLRCNNLLVTATQDKFKFNISMSKEERENRYMGMDFYDYRFKAVDIYVLWSYRNWYVYVDGDNGTDTEICGSEALRCSTLNYGINQLSGLNQVLLYGNYSIIKDEMNITNVFLESFYAAHTIISVRCEKQGIADAGIINGYGNNSIKDAVFECDSDILHSNLISQNEGFLDMQRCELKGVESVDYKPNDVNYRFLFSFVNLKRCKFYAVNITLTNMIFDEKDGRSSVPFIFNEVTDVFMVETLVENITCSGEVFEIMFGETIINVEMEKMIANNIQLKSNPFFYIIFSYNTELLNFTRGTNTFSLFSCNFSNVHTVSEGCSILKVNESSESVSVECTQCIFKDKDSALLDDKDVLISVSNQIAVFTRCSFIGNKLNESTDSTDISLSVCEWSGSLLEINGGKAILAETLFANSSKGALSLNDGCNTSLRYCIFEENSPLFTNFESARRNIICSSSSISLNQTSMDSKNSLWIYSKDCSIDNPFNSSSCIFFTPYLSSISYDNTKDDEGNIDVYFNGCLLFPCNISFVLYSSDIETLESSSTPHAFTSFDNEKMAIASLPYSEIIEARWSVIFSVSLKYPSYKGESLETNKVILRNIQRPPGYVYGNGTDNDRSTKGGVTFNWTVGPFIMVLVILIFLIVGLIMIFFYHRYGVKKERRRIEAEDEDSSCCYVDDEEEGDENVHVKPDEGEGDGTQGKLEKDSTTVVTSMDMKSVEELEHSADLQSRLLLLETAHISVEISTDEVDNQNSEEFPMIDSVSFESSSGSTQLPSSNRSSGSCNFPSFRSEGSDSYSSIGSEGSFDFPSLSNYEITDNSSTSSLPMSGNFTTSMITTKIISDTACLDGLFDAFSCIEPYDQSYVDMQQSLALRLASSESEYDLSNKPPKEKEEICARITFWVLNGIEHYLSEEEGYHMAVYLSPYTIIFGEEGTVFLCIVRSASDEELSSLPVSAANKLKKLCESQRWTAPEVLRNKEYRKENEAIFGDSEEDEEVNRVVTDEPLQNAIGEKSVIFSIGMIMYEFLSLSEPFAFYDSKTASELIIEGKRPPLRKLSKNHKEFCKIIEKCWADDPNKRLTFRDLKLKLIDVMPETKEEEEEEEEESEEEELEVKKLEEENEKREVNMEDEKVQEEEQDLTKEGDELILNQLKITSTGEEEKEEKEEKEEEEEEEEKEKEDEEEEEGGRGQEEEDKESEEENDKDEVHFITEHLYYDNENEEEEKEEKEEKEKEEKEKEKREKEKKEKVEEKEKEKDDEENEEESDEDEVHFITERLYYDNENEEEES